MGRRREETEYNKARDFALSQQQREDYLNTQTSEKQSMEEAKKALAADQLQAIYSAQKQKMTKVWAKIEGMNEWWASSAASRDKKN